jgi:hypothetical protein
MLAMRWKALKYALPLLLFFAALIALQTNGWLVFLPVIISFVFLPLLELIFPPDSSIWMLQKKPLQKQIPCTMYCSMQLFHCNILRCSFF